MLRRAQRVARALYMPTLPPYVAAMSDAEVASLYTHMVAPSVDLADRTFAAWRALPPVERDDAAERMRFQLARNAPRSKR